MILSTTDAGIFHYSLLLKVQQLLLFIVVALIEAAVLKALRWADWGIAFRDSVVMNLVSLAAAFPLHMYRFVMRDRGLFETVLLTWAISVLLEGCVLMLSHRQATRYAWRAALAANVVTYLLMHGCVVLSRGTSLI